MNDKNTVNDWLESDDNAPPAGSDSVIGSSVAAVANVGNVPTDNESKETPQKNFAKLSPDISFIGEAQQQEGAYYAMIQGHKISRNNTRIRIFLIHSIVDIDTSDAAGLRRIIYQRQHSEIKAGESYQGVRVIKITFTDFDNVPPIPA